MDRLTVSVIMPALNEEVNLLSAINGTLAAFKDMDIDGNIVVINDGSRDRTGEIAAEAAAKTVLVTVLNHDHPHGVGASFWDGVDHASGDIVCMIPGDNENDPWETLRYHKLLEHVDIVIPFVYNRGVRSIYRNVLSYVYRSIINTTFLVNFNYTNGTVLYRKSILKELDSRNSGFFFQTDILIRLAKKGYLFAEVPYRLDVRGSGKSKAISFPSFVKVVKGYTKLVKGIYLTTDSGEAKGIFSPDSLTMLRRGQKTPIRHDMADDMINIKKRGKR